MSQPCSLRINMNISTNVLLMCLLASALAPELHGLPHCQDVPLHTVGHLQAEQALELVAVKAAVEGVHLRRDLH